MFKDSHGRTYIAVAKENCSKEEAIKVANRHFKIKKNLLEVQSGKLNKDNDLEIGVRGDLWVVSRKVGA